MVIEDTIKHLGFLDNLKSSMGQEMNEMMSEEISRVMGEQRALERQYASLIQRRGELKGLSKKNELEQTKQEIITVSKQLKDSTRALCRVLKDNPDVSGNLVKIKNDKGELTRVLTDLLEELKELTYSNFKNYVVSELDAQGELDRLRD